MAFLKDMVSHPHNMGLKRVGVLSAHMRVKESEDKNWTKGNYYFSHFFHL